jgi:hypothetical protein
MAFPLRSTEHFMSKGKPMPIEPTNALLGLAFLAVWALAGQVMASDP